MRQSTTSHSLPGDLKKGLELLLCQQAAHLASLNWRDPEEVALAEKRGRIIQVHRGNVEKTLGMDDNEQNRPDIDDPFGGDTDALRRALGARLLRHAHALGREELARRLRARGLAEDVVGLAVSGPAGPDGAGG